MKIEEMFPEMLKRYEYRVEQERKQDEEMMKKQAENAQRLKVLIESIISTVRYELENNMQDEICDAYVRFRFLHRRVKNPQTTVYCELQDENGFTMMVVFAGHRMDSCYHACKIEAMPQFLKFLADSDYYEGDEAKSFSLGFSLNENFVVFEWDLWSVYNGSSERFKTVIRSAFPEGVVRCRSDGFYKLKLHMD